MMIRRLVLGNRNKPCSLERAVNFLPDRLEIDDEIHLGSPVRIQEVALPRLHTAMHMGSAKYFRSSDAEPILSPEIGHLVRDLQSHRRAKNSFALVWQGDGGPMLQTESQKVVDETAEVAAIQ